MNFDFQSRFCWLFKSLLFSLIVCLPSGFALGQGQSGVDTSSDDAKQSWTATTQPQLPSNLNPTRTSKATPRLADAPSTIKVFRRWELTGTIRLPGRAEGNGQG